MEHLYDTSHEFRSFCDKELGYSDTQAMAQPQFHQSLNDPHFGFADADLGPCIPNVEVASMGFSMNSKHPYPYPQYPVNATGSRLPPDSLLFSPLTNPPTQDSAPTSQPVDSPEHSRYKRTGPITSTITGSQPHHMGFCPFPNCSEPIHDIYEVAYHLKKTHIRDGVQISSRKSRKPYPYTGNFICEVPGCGRSTALNTYVEHYKQHILRYFCPVPHCGYHSGKRRQLESHAKMEHNGTVDVSGVWSTFIKQC